MEQRLVRSAGSWGPAGGVMGSVIVPAVWIGQERGPKDGARNPGIKKKKREGRGGDTSITCAPSDPSLPLPLHGQTCCLRGGAYFHRQMHNPLLCSRQRLHLFPSGTNLIATISPLMCLSFISTVGKFQFSWKILSERLIFLLRIYVWSGNVVMRYQIKEIQQNRKKKKKKQQITRAAPSNTSSRLHAAVILYFAAPGCAHTVSDRDWCKINTSQECDVLIKSLCCSDRRARRVRGGLQRGPLWSCQVWPSKADEAVRLLICLYWRAPSPPWKPSPLSASPKKICSPSKAEAAGSDSRSEAKYILKANSLPFATCF